MTWDTSPELRYPFVKCWNITLHPPAHTDFWFAISLLLFSLIFLVRRIAFVLLYSFSVCKILIFSRLLHPRLIYSLLLLLALWPKPCTVTEMKDFVFVPCLLTFSQPFSFVLVFFLAVFDSALCSARLTIASLQSHTSKSNVVSRLMVSHGFVSRKQHLRSALPPPTTPVPTT